MKKSKLVRFCTAVAEYQVGKGRFFFFDHPVSAVSWSLKEFGRLKRNEPVGDVMVRVPEPI